MTMRLADVATVIRSKNAGPFELTLDILFRDRQVYEAFRDARVMNARTAAALYRIAETDVLAVIAMDAAQAIKVTLRRRLPSGSPGETDVYGAQQHAPLVDFEFELD